MTTEDEKGLSEEERAVLDEYLAGKDAARSPALPDGGEGLKVKVEPAPKPGGIDFSNWTYNTLPERTGNAGWQPDLQDLIDTAINHVEGDYEDADDNCAEQVIERLVLAIKAILTDRQPPSADPGTVGGWRPIGTAPDPDGIAVEIILGYWPGDEMHTGYVSKGRWFPAEGGDGEKWSMPSHWQPLPPPPQDGSHPRQTGHGEGQAKPQPSELKDHGADAEGEGR